MHEPQRVTFQFGPKAEVYDVDELPHLGDRVTYDDELWIVMQVRGDSSGAFVLCERPRREQGEPKTLW